MVCDSEYSYIIYYILLRVRVQLLPGHGIMEEYSSYGLVSFRYIVPYVAYRVDVFLLLILQ